MRLADRRAGFDAEFLDQAGPQVTVHGESLGLTAGAVQGEHELTVVGLAQRVLGDQRRQLGNDLGQACAAQVEFGLVAPLQQEQPRLLQALYQGVTAEVGGEPAERGAAPEREPGRTGPYDTRPVPPGMRGPRLGDPGVEDMHVQLAVSDA